MISRRKREVDEIVDDGFHRIAIADAADTKKWQQVRAAVRELPPETSILITDFEKVRDAKLTARTLDVVEHLVRVTYPVVLLSTVTTQTIGASIDEKFSERWHKLASQFIILTEDDIPEVVVATAVAPAQDAAPKPFKERLRAYVAAVPGRLRSGALTLCEFFRPDSVQRWLELEASGDPVLAGVSQELAHANIQSREQVIDEFSERGAAYYGALWSSCSESEKVVLYHLAQQGLVNGKNRAIIRRLTGRRIIRRRPHLQLINESFRRFVVAASAREGIDRLHASDYDPWAAVSRPIAFVAVVVAVVFLVTQQDVLNATTGVITGLAGGIPAVLKLVGSLTERRQSP